MKKKQTLSLIATMAGALLLAGCSTNEPASGTSLNLQLPDEYHIELTVSDNGTFDHAQNYAIIRTNEGVYLYIGDTQTSYIFEKLPSGKYIQYQKDKNASHYTTPTIPASLWEQINAGNVALDSVACDESAFNSLSSVFTTYFNDYAAVSQHLNYEGSETVAGWQCEKYSMKTGHFGGNTVNEYWIEPTTGLCLKSIQRYKSLFLTNERTVECTVFELNGLSLPNHE